MTRIRKGGLLAALMASALWLWPAMAGAQHPSTNSFMLGGFVDEALVDRFAACPPDEAFEGGPADVCVSLRAYDGELKIGDVVATIDQPIEAAIGVRIDTSQGHEFVVGGNGDGDGLGGPGEVPISGGILGIPELDPILELEPLGLLTLAAEPEIGEDFDAQHGPQEDLSLLQELTLPLSIKLNNTLFGDNCYVGTPEDPIVIELTTGTTDPPEGFEPMQGMPGPDPMAVEHRNYDLQSSTNNRAVFESREGTLSVANTFDVPGATGCDFLPEETQDALGDVGDGLEDVLQGASDAVASLGGGESDPLDLGLGELLGNGLFSPVINEVVGLPSPAGENHMRISVDASSAWLGGLELVRGEAGDPLFTVEPGTIDLGEVEVGSTSSAHLVTVTNLRDHAQAFQPDAGVPTGFFGFDSEFFSSFDDCAGATLAPGESCQFAVRWAPTQARNLNPMSGHHYTHLLPGAFGNAAPWASVVGMRGAAVE